MKLSVIIPVYNKSIEKLKRCFDSARFPNVDEFEVIIVDDGSNLETGLFCRDYAKNNYHFQYYYQKNKGVSSARNTGLGFAKGKYITFLDADDELIGRSIDENLLIGEKDILFFDYELHESNQIQQIELFPEVFENTALGKMCVFSAYEDQINTSWGKLYRRAFLKEKQILFDESMVVAEDAEFVLKALVTASSVDYIRSHLYRYYHTFSTSDLRLVKFRNRIIENQMQLLNIRMELLASFVKRHHFDSCEKMRLTLFAHESFIRGLFETTGSMLILGGDHGEWNKKCGDLVDAIYNQFSRHFAPRSRLKCFLLYKDQRLLIKLYAYLREIYIRVKR